MIVRITERALAGIGRCYDIPLQTEMVLAVVILDRGGCELSLRRDDDDTPSVAIQLNDDERLALAAILTGARLSIERDEASSLDAEPS